MIIEILIVYIYFPCYLSFLFHDQADNDPNLHGKKKARKTTQAGGSGLNLTEIAAEQRNKLQKDKAAMISATKTAIPEKAAAASTDSNTSASASGSGTGSLSDGSSAFESSAGSVPAFGLGASPDIGRTGKDGLHYIFSHNKK